MIGVVKILLNMLYSLLFQKKHLLMLIYTCMRGSIFNDEKGLVSHVDFPFQIFEYDDCLDFLESMDLVAKPLVDEEMLPLFHVKKKVATRIMML